ncbi:Meiotically up-regulated 71 protein [Rhodotorula toruloides ATCC 204091]|nr:Meiotically up-regulated 71 protein [Rhodotorula toruloides ATCC 204091]
MSGRWRRRLKAGLGRGARAGVRESVQPCSNLFQAAERAPVPASECGLDQVSADCLLISRTPTTGELDSFSRLPRTPSSTCTPPHSSRSPNNSMKTVALLSGGKDSVYNLLHCVANGHEPVAVASLGPPAGKDELDSFMYQTVGHSGLATIAQALDLPFFSRAIKGTAVNVGGEYGTREGKEKGKQKENDGDETEDLYELLKEVKEAMPLVQGVSVGAILSNYQRVRVEHVCARLGLTPLAYLWERSQPELLREMVEAGMESVLVKVAGAGLQVEHLGKSLKDMEPTLHRLNKRYELHVCGEGGEYETFTLDCPLFKRHVNLDKYTLHVSDPSPFSTVAHLHLDSLSLGPPKPDVPVQDTFDELRERVKRELTEDGWLDFGEVLASPDKRGEEVSIEDEVRSCFEELQAILDSHNTSLLSLAHLTVLLSPSAETMSLFPRINAVYASYFGSSPPTRACVAVPGRGNWRVKLEGVAKIVQDGAREERKALHVQSLSYWAPANIGPYSQSVKTGGRLYVAGQIPLIPPSLTLPPCPSSSTSSDADSSDISSHLSLALQHLHRIIRSSASPSPQTHFTSSTMQARASHGVCWFAPTSSSDLEWRRRVAAARAVWEASEEAYLLAEDAEYDGEEEERVRTAPFLAVEAAALPRGAEVEWVAEWDVPQMLQEDEDNDDEQDRSGGFGKDETWVRSTTVSNQSGRLVSYQCSQAPPRSNLVTLILAAHKSESGAHPLPSVDTSAIHSLKVFYRSSRLSRSEAERLAFSLCGLDSASSQNPALSFIPVGRIATGGAVEEQWDVGVVGVAARARA